MTSKYAYYFYDKISTTDNVHNNDYTNPITKIATLETILDKYERVDPKTKEHIFYQNQVPSEMHLFKVKLYEKNYTDYKITCCLIGINKAKLEEYVLQNKITPNINLLNFLINLMKYHINYSKEDFNKENGEMYISSIKNTAIDDQTQSIITQVTTAIDYSTSKKIKQPDELTVKLYDYQKASINFMLNIEKKKLSFNYTFNYEVDIGNIYYDQYMKSFKPISEKNYLKFLGGALIDEVGLGKTIQMITLSLLNPSDIIDHIRKDVKNKFYSGATLILCPNQLCGQWLREFGKRIKKENTPKIIDLRTKVHYDKLSYLDLLDADFIVVSYQFMSNKTYTSSWIEHKDSIKWDIKTLKHYREKFNNLGEKLIQDPIRALFEEYPLLQLIHWHRIIIDEFHEIYSNKAYTHMDNLTHFLSADNKWCVSATPFCKPEIFMKILEFITENKYYDKIHEGLGKEIVLNKKIADHLLTNCFRRNTKESIKNEYTLPEIREEVRWMKFSQTERMIYDAHLMNCGNEMNVNLRQLCCNIQIASDTKDILANCKTLKEIEDIMVKHYKDQVDFLKEKTTKLTEKIDKLTEKIEKRREKIRIAKENRDNRNAILGNEDEEPVNETFIINTNVLEDQLRTKKAKLADYSKKLETQNRTYTFYKNVVEKIKKCNKDGNEKCDICFSEMCEDNTGVTTCGHMFCYECLLTTVKQFGNCPYCKTKISPANVFKLSYEKVKHHETPTADNKTKQDLINEFGTKLTFMILFLKTTKEHTIIFSQWHSLLEKVGVILEKNNIPNVFCKGNCYQRDKAIREFNENDTKRVIMLSSDSMAAGTNLTKATQIILLDPIYGEYKYRMEQEQQAVGRAHRMGQTQNIKIIRFLVKDTVEEKIYLANCKEDGENKSNNKYIVSSKTEINLN